MDISNDIEVGTGITAQCSKFSFYMANEIDVLDKAKKKSCSIT